MSSSQKTLELMRVRISKLQHQTYWHRISKKQSVVAKYLLWILLGICVIFGSCYVWKYIYAAPEVKHVIVKQPRVKRKHFNYDLEKLEELCEISDLVNISNFYKRGDIIGVFDTTLMLDNNNNNLNKNDFRKTAFNEEKEKQKISEKSATKTSAAKMKKKTCYHQSYILANINSENMFMNLENFEQIHDYKIQYYVLENTNFGEELYARQLSCDGLQITQADKFFADDPNVRGARSNEIKPTSIWDGGISVEGRGLKPYSCIFKPSEDSFIQHSYDCMYFKYYENERNQETLRETIVEIQAQNIKDSFRLTACLNVFHYMVDTQYEPYVSYYSGVDEDSGLPIAKLLYKNHHLFESYEGPISGFMPQRAGRYTFRVNYFNFKYFSGELIHGNPKRGTIWFENGTYIFGNFRDGKPIPGTNYKTNNGEIIKFYWSQFQ